MEDMEYGASRMENCKGLSKLDKKKIMMHASSIRDILVKAYSEIK
jgi:hypothetical protein